MRNDTGYTPGGLRPPLSGAGAALATLLFTLWQAGECAGPSQSAGSPNRRAQRGGTPGSRRPRLPRIRRRLFRARVAGAIDAKTMPNSGTKCQGETKSAPPGGAMSFQRSANPRRFIVVFGLTGVREGQPVRATGAKPTLTFKAPKNIRHALATSRCTVDSLLNARLRTRALPRRARGFCTQPAHAVRGTDRRAREHLRVLPAW